MFHHFPVGKSGPSSRLQGRVVDKYIGIVRSEDNPAATRGFCLALGHLPPKLLAPSSAVLDSILSCLICASRKDTLVGNEGDAETRRNALISLVKVCTAVGLVTNEMSPSTICPLSKCQLERVFESMFEALQDYNTDRRGDVGSWSRMVAIDGIETLAYLAIRATTTFPHSCKLCAATETLTDVPGCFQRRVQRLPQSLRFTYFDDKLAHSILDALLKQLGEIKRKGWISCMIITDGLDSQARNSTRLGARQARASRDYFSRPSLDFHSCPIENYSCKR